MTGEYVVALRYTAQGTARFVIRTKSGEKVVFEQTDRLEGAKGEGWLIRIRLQVDAGIIVEAAVTGVEPLGDEAPEKVVKTELAIKRAVPIEATTRDSGALDSSPDDNVSDEDASDGTGDEDISDRMTDKDVTDNTDDRANSDKAGDQGTNDGSSDKGISGDKDVRIDLGGQGASDNTNTGDPGSSDVGARNVSAADGYS